MAHQWFRANLNASSFPLATELWGRSVMIPQQDENYEKVLVSGTDLSKDKGIPQAYYMHNCMPTDQGYQAVGYELRDPGIDGETSFDDIFPFQNSDLQRYLYSPAGGKNYIYDLNQGGWISVNPWAPGTILKTTMITTGFVNSQTYICLSQIGLFIYDSIAVALVQQFPVGILENIATLKGFCAAEGYGVYFDEDSIVWSSNTDPLDCTPSLVTGAGGGKLQEAKGRIITVLPIANGFMVYCEKNIVSARYTGNLNYPWNFKEVQGSSGITTPEDVSWQTNLEYHYAWTTAGLLQVDMNNASSAFPAVTEFLAKKIYEDFDESSLTFTSTYTTQQLNVKVTMIEENYLVISYGINPNLFTYALVYDTGLGRMGKLKIDHVDCFQWNSPGGIRSLTYGDLLSTTYGELNTVPYSYADLFAGLLAPFEEPKKTIAFLSENGEMQTVNFDLDELDADGVLLLGKYQSVRNRRMQHQRTTIENKGISDFDSYVLTTQDGKTFDPALELINIGDPASKVQRLARLCEGENFSILFLGSFNMVSCQIDYTLGGQT